MTTVKVSRRWTAALVAALLALDALGLGGGGPQAHAATRVGVVNGQLTLDGRPWWPSGFDAYELGTKWAVNKGCGAQVDLDAYFASLPPNSLTRFDAFSSMGTGPLDAVFAAAQRHGQLLVAVLASGEGACEDGEFKDTGWYLDGWRESYADWLTTAVSRWGNSPALAGWEMVGEPEPRTGKSCPDNAAAILRGFFDQAGARLRALDTDTPIWEGVAGGDQCGIRGEDYVTVGRSPSIDVLDLHDYGATDVGLRLRQAAAIGKPLVVAEMGRFAGSCGSLSERAADMAAAVAAQRRAGSAGVLFWAFVPDPRTGECTMDIGPKDPLFGLVRSLAD
ncbi:MAG: beta-mannosidase [Candidatus Nanopelagicales bacterium]